MAEGIFWNLVRERGIQDKWTIDSAGTGSWHIGCPPHSGTMKVLKERGVTGYKHAARVITKEDFNDFDYIFGMDHENIEDIKEVAPSKYSAQLLLLGSFDPEKVLTVQDPYYTQSTNKNAFNEVYDQCLRCCVAFLDSLS